MAILKDLIVHGSSRFLNKIYANELETSTFEADSAVIKKLKADDATVVGLLDVQGELHTNSWTNSNIATIDGSFYITPTIGSDSGTVAVTATSLVFSGSNYAVTSLYLGDNTQGAYWKNGSKVLVTGQILYNSEYIPLGTLVGELGADATNSSINIINITTNKKESSSSTVYLSSNILSEIGEREGLPYRNLKVSLYQRKFDSSYYPLGIYLTALGESGKTFLDIYGGVNDTSTKFYKNDLNQDVSNGGFADPNVRIGNLSGLAPIITAAGSFTPQGWGIYTTNGYFKGTVIADQGIIGGWRLTSNSIYSGNSAFGNASGMYFGANGLSLGSTFQVTNQGSLTATSGQIGKYKITNTYLYTGEGSSQAGMGATNQAFWAGSTTSDSAPFRVSYEGEITATNAHIEGGSIKGSLVTSGINANNITTGSLKADRIAIGDYNNYITVTEKNERTLPSNVEVTQDGWLYKKVATDSNIWLSPVLSNWTTQGEQYRITGLVKMDIDGRCDIIIYGRDANGTSVSGALVNTTGIPITANTETEIDTILTISNTMANQVKCNIAIAFYSGSSGTTKTNGYFKNLKCERMTGGSLLVEGSITTNKLAANAITIGTMSPDTQQSILNDNISVGGRNLASKASVSSHVTAFSENNYVYQGSYGAGAGLKFDGIFEQNENYVLSYKIKKISGTFAAIGGHSAGFSCNGFYIDGIKSSKTYSQGDSITDDTNIHSIQVFLKFNGDATDNRLYIQPNRNDYLSGNTSVFQIWDIKIEKGTKATDWTPAPQDVENRIVDAGRTANNYISVTSNGIKIANANPATSTYYQLQTSLGTSFYANSIKRSEITANGFYIYDNNSNNNPIASFDATISTNPAITLGKTNGKNVKINNDGLTINNGSTPLASYGENIVIGSTNLANLQISSDKIIITGPNQHSFYIIPDTTYDYIDGDQTDDAIQITDENEVSRILLAPDILDNGGFSKGLLFDSVMTGYNLAWFNKEYDNVTDASDQNEYGALSLDGTGFSIFHPNWIFDISQQGKMTLGSGDNWQQPLFAYQDVVVSISYAAGTIGTRGALETVGTTSRSGYYYLGATILNHQSTTQFKVDITRNRDTAYAYVVAYRASTAAVSNASVSVRKIWVNTRIVQNLT